MAAIDIRAENKEEITEIIFADYTYEECPTKLARCIPEVCDGMVGIVPGDSGEAYSILTVRSEQHAKDLIAALQKSIELGWYARKD